METIKDKKIKIARTRNGVPCLWESLMTFADLRRATVIYGKDMKPKNNSYITKFKVPIILPKIMVKTDI